MTLVTEGQAATTACPEHLGAPFTIPDHGKTFHGCIGSRCMWWRVGDPANGAILERMRIGPTTNRPAGWDYKGDEGLSEYVRYEKIARGFCGMAGSP